MEFTFKSNEIISATDMSKNFAACRDKVKCNARGIIFKNNKPDLAMLDISEYERITTENAVLNELLEDLEILALVKERAAHDDGTRYSLEDVKRMLAAPQEAHA